MTAKLARVRSQAILGIDSPRVDVEVHVSNGLPAFHIVGLPDAAVRESRDRVRAAIIESGFEFPNTKYTVNLAPADLPKDSGRFDLPIAIGVLIATTPVGADRLDDRVLVGELSLNGSLRPMPGAMAMALALARQYQANGMKGRLTEQLVERPTERLNEQPTGNPIDQSTETPADQRSNSDANAPTLVLPEGCGAEAAFVPGVFVQTAATLRQVFEDLNGEQPLAHCVAADESSMSPDPNRFGDFAEVRGQQQVKRALEIAAAGSHSVLLVGPPGAGKSMLAQRLPSILPTMADAEALDAGAVASLAGRFDPSSWRTRPFRAPHHSASMAALVGGGQKLRPGEISLAHNGILFLDELPEFGARTLDSLREPLETGRIALSRAARQLELPARFQLIAAMNPCTCGHYGTDRCRCTPDQVLRYQRRVSGPLLDRLDLHLWIAPVPVSRLTSAPEGEASATIAIRVRNARDIQMQRQQMPNARLGPLDVAQYCKLNKASATLLHRTANRLEWSGRVFHRIQKIARTIADLAGVDEIDASHVAEAVSLRRALGLVNAP